VAFEEAQSNIRKFYETTMSYRIAEFTAAKDYSSKGLTFIGFFCY
jgi:hypothetical protein